MVLNDARGILSFFRVKGETHVDPAASATGHGDCRVDSAEPIHGVDSGFKQSPFPVTLLIATEGLDAALILT